MMIPRILLTGFYCIALVLPAAATHIDDHRREAGLPSVTHDRLWELAESKDWQVRQTVARNRRSPRELLYQLAGDKHPQVRIGVATNLSSDERTFMLLAKDKDVQVRSVVARFEYVPVATLQLLAYDHQAEIRLEVARNLNSNRDILETLSKDTDPDVSNVAQQALQRLKQDAP